MECDAVEMESVTVRWPDVSWPAGRQERADRSRPLGAFTPRASDCPTAACSGVLNADPRTHFPFSLPEHSFGFLAENCLQRLFFLYFLTLGEGMRCRK